VREERADAAEVAMIVPFVAGEDEAGDLLMTAHGAPQ
jgi:hypothetical protein